MLRPIEMYLKRLDSAYEGQNHFIRLKARLLSGINVLLVALVVLNLVRIIWLQPPGLPVRILINLIITASVAVSLHKTLQGKLEMAGSYLALGLVIPIHLVVAIVPASYYEQPLGSAFQLIVFDAFLLLLALIFSSKRTAVACFIIIILGIGIHYLRTLSVDPIEGTLRYAADNLARDGLLALSFIFAIGVLLTLMLEAFTKQSEQMLLSIKSMNRSLEKRVRERTKELEEVSRKAHIATQAKSDFLANMSHEIRTPLYGIIAQTELLKEQKNRFSEEDLKELAVISDSGDLLLHLVNDILDFSKIEEQQLHLEPHAFTPNLLVLESIATVASSAEKKGLHIDFEACKELEIPLLGDSHRLKQILLNLLSNAIKFTPKGGKISTSVQILTVEDSVAHLHFKVTDTGIGIDAATKNHIFDRFTQADNSTTRQYGGSGLGLTISSRLVSMMGGQLSVESHPGKGSTFDFSLPFPVVATKVIPKPQSKPYKQLGLNILIAEDNEINRKIIRKQLESLGCTMVFAINGLEALSILNTTPGIQLVLMDNNMPVMDGKRATKIIREWKELKSASPTQKIAAELPIIAFTANVIESSEFENEYPGMTDYLVKPLKMQKLHDALEKHLPGKTE